MSEITYEACVHVPAHSPLEAIANKIDSILEVCPEVKEEYARLTEFFASAWWRLSVRNAYNCTTARDDIAQFVRQCPGDREFFVGIRGRTGEAVRREKPGLVPVPIAVVAMAKTLYEIVHANRSAAPIGEFVLRGTRIAVDSETKVTDPTLAWTLAHMAGALPVSFGPVPTMTYVMCKIGDGTPLLGSTMVFHRLIDGNTPTDQYLWYHTGDNAKVLAVPQQQFCQAVAAEMQQVQKRIDGALGVEPY